jgi:hypothetical protein
LQACVPQMPHALQRFWDGNNGAGFCRFGMTNGTEQKELHDSNKMCLLVFFAYWKWEMDQWLQHYVYSTYTLQNCNLSF